MEKSQSALPSSMVFPPCLSANPQLLLVYKKNPRLNIFTHSWFKNIPSLRCGCPNPNHVICQTVLQPYQLQTGKPMIQDYPVILQHGVLVGTLGAVSIMRCCFLKLSEDFRRFLESEVEYYFVVTFGSVKGPVHTTQLINTNTDSSKFLGNVYLPPLQLIISQHF